MHVQRYRRRISGPLLDRIDLRVELSAPTVDELAVATPIADPNGESAAHVLAERVARAREIQRSRQGERTNAELDADQLDQLDELAPLRGNLRPVLTRAAKQRDLSARAVQSIRRVARTLADLDAAPVVAVEHVARALALRSPNV
jgi:magnesium chelatase family protein